MNTENTNPTIEDLMMNLKEEKNYHLDELFEYIQYLEELESKDYKSDSQLNDVLCHLRNLKVIHETLFKISEFKVNFSLQPTTK